MLFRIKFFLQNWKLGIHLMFHTYRFGVNNQWWNPYDSMFGLPWHSKKKWNVVMNYRHLRIRCGPGICAVTEDTFKKLFPIYAKKKYPWMFENEKENDKSTEKKKVGSSKPS